MRDTKTKSDKQFHS